MTRPASSQEQEWDAEKLRQLHHLHSPAPGVNAILIFTDSGAVLGASARVAD